MNNNRKYGKHLPCIQFDASGESPVDQLQGCTVDAASNNKSILPATTCLQV